MLNQPTFNSFQQNEINSSAFWGGRETGKNPENLVNQSTTILREYLATAAPVRQQYIEHLLKEKNYWELTQFFFRGQKIRGSQPITNETDFLNQEKTYLLDSKSISRIILFSIVVPENTSSQIINII